MTAEERDQMNGLCIRIQNEKTYDAFITLARQLCNLIERKEVRFGRGDRREWQRTSPWRTTPAVVRKVFKSVHPTQPEKVEISIPAAEELFREIRIENTLIGIDGPPVSLQEGDHLDITFEAEARKTSARATDPTT
jgi:hypothetical protein